MTKNWFKIEVSPTGERYIIQNVDEMDKNHGEDDPNLANQGKMYEVPGESEIIHFKYPSPERKNTVKYSRNFCEKSSC